ncbi:MAG: YbaN family protein [Candidatus Lokiarchaeota archaeon]|nr:YbaN family protein [Candidatus Lokiarchaeota archaeon]
MKKFVFILLGFIFVALGVIGIPIPILPTTPFMLLAGYFFLRSSEKLNNWLRNHKYFKRFFARNGLTLWGKILLDGAVWIMLVTTAIFANKIWVWILTMSLGVIKTLYFIFVLKTIPSKRKLREIESKKKESSLITE